MTGTTSTPSPEHILRNIPAIRTVPIARSDTQKIKDELAALVTQYLENGGTIEVIPAQEVPHHIYTAQPLVSDMEV